MFAGIAENSQILDNTQYFCEKWRYMFTFFDLEYVREAMS